jgi:hypothetical protein
MVGRPEAKPLVLPMTLEMSLHQVKTNSLDKMKSEIKAIETNEPIVISCLHQIYDDNKKLRVFLDSVKSAYVVDNTKLIELEETGF